MRLQKTPTGGLYGKLPSYGDFLHRGLPTAFVEAWNAWVEPAMGASRTALGDAWMGAYLNSPPWRFMLEPGIIGAAGWLGVFASSVDRVGRGYPMTVALGLPHDARLAALTSELTPIFDALERIVLQLIDGGWTPDAVTNGIAKLADALPAAAASNPVLSRNGPEWLTMGATPLPIASLATGFQTATGADGQAEYPLSGWWNPGWNGHPAAHLVSFGLPAPDLFLSMLDGKWRGRGWTDGSAG